MLKSQFLAFIVSVLLFFVLGINFLSAKNTYNLSKDTLNIIINNLTKEANSYFIKGDYKNAYLIDEQIIELQKMISEIELKNIEQKFNDTINGISKTKTDFEQSVNNDKSILKGIIIFVLIDVLGMILYFYLEKKRTYLKLVKKNMDWAELHNDCFNSFNMENMETNPEFNNIDAKEKQLLINLLELFNKEKIFLKKEIVISDIAKKLNTNKVVVSKLINTFYKNNFPTVINEFRIKEAINLLSDKQSSSYTLEAIGEICGFKNRQVFHYAFKKTTGVTPNDFRKMSQQKDFKEEVSL